MLEEVVRKTEPQKRLAVAFADIRLRILSSMSGSWERYRYGGFK
jgi:hypothetical protein